jgi:hypothetical protein
MEKRCPFVHGDKLGGDSCVSWCSLYNDELKCCEIKVISQNLSKLSNSIYDADAPDAIVFQGASF